MLTELTFRYRHQVKRVTLKVLNPSNAGAVFLAAHPEIKRSDFTVINCIGCPHGARQDFFGNTLLLNRDLTQV